MKGDVLGLFTVLVIVFWTQNFQGGVGHHATCDRTYSKVDCIDTYQKRKRVYNELIITDRDSHGIPIDWFHWEEYLLGLVCRCLEKLNKLSDGDLNIYNQFTLENYGECWSSRTGYDSLHSFTRANSCVGAGFLDCNTSTMSECTGSNLASFLYQVNNRTKLLGEHCEIVKKIVCLSSTIPLNSSTTFLGKTTVFQSFETSRMDSTVSPSWQTVLRNTTKTQKLTSSQNLKSTAVLNNTSEIILSEHYGKPSSTIEAMATEILALKTSSPDVLKESAGQKLSYQTYSLLSQMQTLNTGKLYTSGSKILNMTLAPTQFFITSSLRSIGNVSSVESTSSFSETSERSSRTNSVMLSSTYGNFVYSTTSKIGGTTSPPSQQNITTTILLQSDIVMSTLSKSRQLNNGNVSATEIYNSSFLQQSREVTSTSQYDGTKKSTSKLETSQIEASYTKTQANHERSTISTFKNNSTSYLTSITSSTLSSTSFEQTQIRQSTLNENKVSNELTTKESKTIPAQQSKSKNLNNPSVKGNSAAAQSSSIYRMIAIHLIFINLLQLLK